MKTRVLFTIVAISAAGRAQTLPLPTAGNVTLPLDEYVKLVELAGQPPKPTNAPPFPYVIKSARMNLRVTGELITGTVLVEGEVLAKGDRKVSLVNGMTVLDAQQQGRELPLQQEGGTHVALLPGPSEFAVTLETAQPLSIETGRAFFNLPVPAAGAVRLTLSVPGDQTQVNLSPGLITGRSSHNGRTTIEATLQPGQAANIWWASRLTVSQAPVAPKEVRFLSDVKTLISVSEGELTVAALVEITVVQGEPSQFEILAPEGYELTGATGPTLVASDVQAKSIVLRVSTPSARSHQFLVSLAKSNTATKADIPLITFLGTQRETGEVLIEGDGAIELTASERGGLRRMDLKETSPYLRSLARTTLEAAFRYQKRPAEAPAVGLEWVRFPDSKVLSAVAQHAVVTTLVTSEGRSLTEVKLTLKNQSQPFLKVELPAGASIVTADVAGEKVKPVQGADGNRVPLLRPGFRPAGSYGISFVYLHAGTPFGKKGAAELAIPRMDVPIGRVDWEVFVPQQYRLASFGGDALFEELFPVPGEDATAEPGNLPVIASLSIETLGPEQLGGIVTDPAGGVVPRASVTVLHRGTGITSKTATDSGGRWSVANVPAGFVRITVDVPGFKKLIIDANHSAARGTRRDLSLEVGSASESVTVTEKDSMMTIESSQIQRNARQNAASADVEASANVADLQRRVVGVLPIAMNVPRTGSSYRFVRPLVADEETKLTFKYRSR